ncbi:LppX_LprAFG lipoprotein [Mycobacterium sp.]|uniref:LppX_LprAFG lipoprotein n=1 Tax=Mycobacterium sp. TaxID=1785 RepID=UPI003A868103
MQGMANIRRLFAALIAICAATTLVAGCSAHKKDSGGPLPDAQALITQSIDTTRAVKSAHIVLTVNGEIPGLSISSLEGDLTTDPTAAKGDVKLNMAGTAFEAGFVVLDGTLYATLTPNRWSNFGKASDVYDVSQILSQDKGLANVLSNFTDAKAEGRENINGQDTIRISGKASPEAVNAIAPPFSASEPVPATVWIQEAGDHQLAQALLERGTGNSVQMTLSNWGQPVQVTKPPLN